MKNERDQSSLYLQNRIRVKPSGKPASNAEQLIRATELKMGWQTLLLKDTQPTERLANWSEEAVRKGYIEDTKAARESAAMRAGGYLGEKYGEASLNPLVNAQKEALLFLNTSVEASTSQTNEIENEKAA